MVAHLYLEGADIWIDALFIIALLLGILFLVINVAHGLFHLLFVTLFDNFNLLVLLGRLRRRRSFFLLILLFVNMTLIRVIRRSRNHLIDVFNDYRLLWLFHLLFKALMHFLLELSVDIAVFL